MRKVMISVGCGLLAVAAPISVAVADGGAPGTNAGAYVGARIGHGWSDLTARSGVDAQDYDAEGVFGGILAGYDYPLQGPWTVGAIIDFSTGNERGTAIQPSGPVIFKLEQQWEASLRGRLAYAMPDFTPYATAGLSYGSFRSQYSQVSLPFIAGDDQDLGWTIGAGIDVPVEDRLSMVFEYRYTDYGDDVEPLGIIDGPYDVSSSKIYLGLNFRL